ncbi:hypothetical protein Bca52824_089529 [Brassica carinata]|uniref:RING-CH-type domain-containing protein n=1 Tax=Brassica carinata TaxID=52824 RepID=A0A8X7TQK5_BRACI|nr:hypothetical protein Bca52824_089529 [Brassica carinata]
MDVFPADIEDGGYDRAIPADETDKDDDDDGGELCRICRSPEGPDDPLRFPCACRGSIKYVHQECLRVWLNRRGFKQCEVCRRSYSFVPVYSENAPERLPWDEFLRGLSLRALRVAAYVFVILFTPFASPCILGGKVKFAYLLAGFFLYNGLIVYLMTIMALLKFMAEDLLRIHREIYGGNEHGGGGGVACVIWKSMGILCDWWHDFITRCGFFHAIFVEPRDEVIRPRNPQLREFGSIRRFLFLLDDNAFAVLAISFYVSFFFVLLPFVMGRLVIGLLLLFQRMGVATQLLSGDSLPEEPVVIGYWTVLSLSLAYLGSCATPSRAIAKKLFLGFLMVAVALAYLLWLLSAKLWKNLYVVKLKNGFVLSLKFLHTPIFGITVSRRLEHVSDYPFVMILHWTYGQLWLLLFFNSMELIQKILQKRPFWFLLDVTDPNYKNTKLYLGQFLFALAFHASLMVILVHLPIMTISFVSPSFSRSIYGKILFAFTYLVSSLVIYEERIMFLSMAAYIWLARIRVLHWLIDLIKPAIEPIVHKWIITVSSWLRLSDFFLGNHVNQDVRPLLQKEPEADDDCWSLVNSIGEGSLVRFYGSQNDATSEEDTNDDSCSRFIILRIVLMLVLATVNLFLVSTISMALPILVGRTFFHSISFIMIKLGLKHDDIYGFWIGCYILRVSYVGTCFVLNHIMTRRTDLLLNLVLLWIRNALLFSIWVSFIPTLLGLLFDLMIIIPSQVPLSEPPVYSLLRDWFIGLVVLHIWTYLTMFTRVNCFATVAWREKLKRVRCVGINRLPWTWLLGNVICPIIYDLLTTLTFPFCVANYLFPLLQFSGAVDLAVQRLIWPVLLAIIIIGFVAKLTFDLFHYIHRLEYDDRYMVGDRVTDYIEDQV